MVLSLRESVRPMHQGIQHRTLPTFLSPQHHHAFRFPHHVDIVEQFIQIIIYRFEVQLLASQTVILFIKQALIIRIPKRKYIMLPYLLMPIILKNRTNLLKRIDIRYVIVLELIICRVVILRQSLCVPNHLLITFEEVFDIFDYVHDELLV